MAQRQADLPRLEPAKIMARPLRTVRAKLTALVALPLVVMLFVLPVLSWTLDKELVDEVDDRVHEAETAFRVEFDDDIGDVRIAATLLAGNPATAHALAGHDKTEAHKLAEEYLRQYPDFDILFVDAQGKVLDQVGCKLPRGDIGTVPEFAGLLSGKGSSGVVAHGCEAPGTDAPPAYVVAVPVVGGGAVIVCLPFAMPLLTNAGHKVGVELAILHPGSDRPVVATARFPPQGMTIKGTATTQVAVGKDDWAVARYQVPQLQSAGGGFELLLALDVSDIRDLVHDHLVTSLGAFLLVSLVSVLLGLRVATVMSDALARVSTALKRLEHQEYVVLSPRRTGDELEDLAVGFNTMVEGLKDRDKLRDTFGKYVTPAVAAHLMQGDVELGGKTLPVTILFTDIRGFTTFSESMPAQEIVALLNEYFSVMVGIIMEEGGVVDKYIGDAIMAVFGAPVGAKDDAVRAVRAAIRMRRALVGLNAKLRSRGIPELQTGIGIHTGEVVAGNIGSPQRMEYTVIGDPVNVASRLESTTKELGVNVLISEGTFKAVEHAMEARFVREVQVKGRVAAVRAYEVLGEIGGERRNTVDLNAQQVAALRAGK